MAFLFGRAFSFLCKHLLVISDQPLTLAAAQTHSHSRSFLIASYLRLEAVARPVVAQDSEDELEKAVLSVGWPPVNLSADRLEKKK